MKRKLPVKNTSRLIDVDTHDWQKFKERAKKNKLTVSGLNNILIRDFLSNPDPVWIKTNLV